MTNDETLAVIMDRMNDLAAVRSELKSIIKNLPEPLLNNAPALSSVNTQLDQVWLSMADTLEPLLDIELAERGQVQ